MLEIESMGKILIIVGVIIIACGLIFTFWSKIPLLGHLPGDFSWQKGNVSFFFPLVTSLVISLLLTTIVNIVLRFFR
jgi:uncharacterized membrane-anchored protein YitT (DUF2179 family)